VGSLSFVGIIASCSDEHKDATNKVAIAVTTPAHCLTAGNESWVDMETGGGDNPAAYSRWIGCPIQMLTTLWGAPARNVQLPGDSHVLVWEASEQPPIKGSVRPIALGPPVICDVNVTVDNKGNILGIVPTENWAFGNPPLLCGISVKHGPVFVEPTMP